MNTIEQLNERIAQLTELVKSGSEAIKNMEIALRTAEEERDKLVDQRREQEPKFERVKKEKYYSIDFGRYEGVKVISDMEEGHPLDEARYNNNNYFHTKKRAKEVADKINFLLRLERLHDTFCPDYLPDWNNRDEKRYLIYFDVTDKRYNSCYSLYVQEICGVYFPSKEIAQKVCDILNGELEEKI